MSIKISAGLVLVRNNKILLVHPTKNPWFGTYGIPKGKVEDGETLIEAAIRETEEEVGISIDPEMITDEPSSVIYKNGKGKVRKIVYYFTVDTSRLEIPDVIPKEQLQQEEVDWAGFLSKEEAKERIFWRFADLLENFLE